jgi:hypothetical protein
MEIFCFYHTVDDVVTRNEAERRLEKKKEQQEQKSNTGPAMTA